MCDILQKPSVEASREIFDKVKDSRLDCVVDMMDLMRQLGDNEQEPQLPTGVGKFPVYYTLDACTMYQVLIVTSICIMLSCR